jgi:hypothetical protein
MTTLSNWFDQDAAIFADSVKRYSTRSSAEIYVQSILALYKDQHHPIEQIAKIETCMRDILDRTYFEDETSAAVSGLEAGIIKRDPGSYSRKDWDVLDKRCKDYTLLNIQVRGSDAVRILKLVENRNKCLSEAASILTGKGKMKWDILFDESHRDTS